MSHSDEFSTRWPMMFRGLKLRHIFGIIVLGLGLLSFWQILDLRDRDTRQADAISALSIALQAEQNNQRAEGDQPVAPAPEDIVDDPDILPGKPGRDGRDGEDGADGVGLKGEKGDKGDPGKPAPTITPSPGKDGLNGINGADGADGKDGKDGVGIDGKDGANGADGKPGENGQPPYGWTSYDRNGKIIYECVRVPAEEWDPAKPRYDCQSPDDPGPLG